MGVQAFRLPAPKRLKRLKRLKSLQPLKLAKAFRNAQQLSQGQIHRFFWAVQPAVRQAFAANRHPKATSMASYGRPSLPFASLHKHQNVPQSQINGFLSAFKPAVCHLFPSQRRP